MQDYPEFEEVLRLGREIRKADRPSDFGDEKHEQAHLNTSTQRKQVHRELIRVPPLERFGRKAQGATGSER